MGKLTNKKDYATKEDVDAAVAKVVEATKQHAAVDLTGNILDASLLFFGYKRPWLEYAASAVAGAGLGILTMAAF